MPVCPVWLNPVARTEWKRIGPVLFAAGLLRREDMAAFASYCENYAIVSQCAAYINRKGGYAKYLAGDKKNEKAKNSHTALHLTAMNRAFDKVRAFATEFGLTPSSRGRIEIASVASGDEDLD